LVSPTLTFFGSKHTCLVIEQSGSTPCYGYLGNRYQVQTLAAPQELFQDSPVGNYCNNQSRSPFEGQEKNLIFIFMRKVEAVIIEGAYSVNVTNSFCVPKS